MSLTRTVYTLFLVTALLAGPAMAQLSGPYDIGGGLNHYPSFVPAISDLYASGVSGPVTFNVYGGDYDEWANFTGPIPGASAANTVTFLDASGTARINITAHLGISEGALNLDSCSYLIWDGIDIYLNHVGDSTYKCIALKNNSSNNIFRNADMRGAGFTASTIKYGVYMWSRTCNDNLFDNLHFHRHNTVFYVTGSTTQQHTGNAVQNCTIDNVWRGFYLNYANDFHIRDSDIQNNGAGLSSGRSVEIGTLTSGAAVNIYRNRFHNFVSVGTAAFIDGPGGAGSVLNVYNNFFYDVQTSGTASFYCIYGSAAGIINLHFNSFRINDVAATGALRGYYKSTSTNVPNIQNNIFYFAEATATTRAYHGLSAGYGPGTLDNNAYYNDGGAAFAVYSESTNPVYPTLAALQAATAWEDNGVEGNPGFISATDLHIDPAMGLVSNHGAAIPGISDDIDGDIRLQTPDIGADEYAYLAPPNDYAVTGIIGSPALIPELTPTVTTARVQNRGSAAQVNVPVRLFYNGTQYGQVLVSLASNAVDTVNINWTTPVAGPLGTLEVQSFLPGDANPADDSATVPVQIVGLPMHGTYDIGGGGFNYATFGDAVNDMVLRSVDGPVTFFAYGSTYTETFTIPAIPGASAVNTITFTEAPGNSILITWASTAGTVRFDGADYVTFNGIDIAATASNAQAVRIFGGADNNAFLNASITGAAVSGTSNYAIYVSGGGNDNNRFQNLTLSSSYYGIRLSGASGAADFGNEVTECTVLEGKYGIYLEYQAGGQIHHNDIQPGWGAAATEIFGVYAGAQGASDTVFVYGNQIHNLRVASGASAANGIYTAATASRLRAYNNFIYDFQVAGTGPVYGLRSANGTAEFYFNSVRISDVATTGGTIGINGYYQAGTGTTTLLNNVFQLDETSSAARGIYRSAGTLISNNNAFFNGGANAAFNVGRDGANEYATLELWQGAGYDANSVAGDPGFVDAANLHIQPTFALLNGAGTAIIGISTDIDLDGRGTPPDIGADEYQFTSLAADYGVNGFVGLQPTYITQLPVVINVDVQNFGTSNQTNVPVRLFYNNVQQSQLLVTLAAGVRDTVQLPWTPPATGYEVGSLKAQTFLANDAYPDNDFTIAQVTTVGAPMSGIYHLGGGNMDFVTFSEAMAALGLRGIDGPVTIECWGGTYNEALVLTPIAGTSFTDRVTFQKHLNDQVTITFGTGPVVSFDGADFITFDGINVLNVLSATTVGFQIRNDADYITLRNLSVTGGDSTTASLNSGVSIWRNGNDNVTLDNLTISGWAYGTRMNDGTGQCSNLEVKNCLITGANYGVYVDDVVSGSIHHNEIQPHGALGTSIRVTGVYISSLPAGANLHVYNNRIHNIRYDGTSGSPDVTGVWSTAGTGAGVVVYIYNNFIYGFSAPLGAVDIYGVYVSTGVHHLIHNSIHVPDGSLAARVGGVYLSTSSSNATLTNNIFSMEEADGPAYGIFSNSATATLVSNYNCFYGTGTGFNVGGITTTNYPALTDWQAIGHDANSVAGNPGFVSAANLHIDPSYTLVDGAGTFVEMVTVDFDGDIRNNPPDIGADEYGAVLAPGAVDDLTVYRVGVTDDVILRWTATANAASYLIYAATTSDIAIEPINLIGTTAATSFTHTGTVPGAARLFYVVVASTGPAGRGE